MTGIGSSGSEVTGISAMRLESVSTLRTSNTASKLASSDDEARTSSAVDSVSSPTSSQ